MSEIIGTTETTETQQSQGIGTVQTAPMQEDFVKIDLNSGTVHRRFLDHIICQDNNQATLFGVELMKGGKPATVPDGTTCAGYFIKPDGNTVMITGDIAETIVEGEGQRCWVILPQACYAQPGQFTLVINLHKGNFTTTVRVVDGTIIKTRSGEPIDPGIPVPDIDELLSIIAAAQGNTYDASNGVTLSGATFKLTKAVRQHLNAVRGINLGHAGQAPANQIDLGVNNRQGGWIAIIWHCGTSSSYGIKFAHIAQDQEDETHYYASIVTMLQNGTDHCQLTYDDSEDDPHWHITNTNEDNAHLRAIVLMNDPSETFC